MGTSRILRVPTINGDIPYTRILSILRVPSMGTPSTINRDIPYTQSIYHQWGHPVYSECLPSMGTSTINGTSRILRVLRVPTINGAPVPTNGDIPYTQHPVPQSTINGDNGDIPYTQSIYHQWGHPVYSECLPSMGTSPYTQYLPVVDIVYSDHQWGHPVYSSMVASRILSVPPSMGTSRILRVPTINPVYSLRGHPVYSPLMGDTPYTQSDIPYTHHQWGHPVYSECLPLIGTSRILRVSTINGDIPYTQSAYHQWGHPVYSEYLPSMGTSRILRVPTINGDIPYTQSIYHQWGHPVYSECLPSMGTPRILRVSTINGDIPYTQRAHH